MEPKDSEFVFSTPMANESKNKGKEEELIPNSDSNKRKMSSLQNGSSSNENSQGPTGLAFGRSKKNSFSCKYCPKTFLNSQALGGHQNAHKVERALSKAEKKMSLGRYGYGPDGSYFHGSMGYFPYHQNAMIPNFSPLNFAPEDEFSLFGWNGPIFNSPPQNSISPEENREICDDYPVDGEPNGEEKWEEPLDLTLKL